MKLKTILVATLIIYISFINAYEVGVDYPAYDLTHGRWTGTGGGCIACTPITFENNTINVSRQPILLVHGWSNIANGNTEKDDEWKIEDYLRNEGYDVWRLDYYPANLSSRKNAGVVGESIGKILGEGYRDNGFDNVNVIAHSQGGLAVIGYIHNLGIDTNGNVFAYNDDINKIVTISSPLYGSYFANLVDGITNININEDHPYCQELIDGTAKPYNLFSVPSLNGNSEATKDFEIGSDYIWELFHSNELNKDVSYLTIAGHKLFDETSGGSPAYGYCLSNHDETNDGVVSTVYSHLLDENVPLVLLNNFHAVTSSIKDDFTSGQIANLFFKDELSRENVEDKIGNNEFFYESLSQTQTKEGAIIIDVDYSEIQLDDISINNDFENLSLEKNINTERWFYVDKSNIVPEQSIDFTTLIPFDNYKIAINGFYFIDIEVDSLTVSLLSLNLDSDADNFDIDIVGGSDCDDSRDLTYPGAFESCNLIDDNCIDDLEDDGFNETWFNETTNCGIGECSREGSYLCIIGEKEDTCAPGDPVDEIRGDGADNNCDGFIGDLSHLSNNETTINLSSENFTSHKVESDEKILIEFDFDVTRELLDIENFSIQQNSKESSYSYLIIGGLDLDSQNETKTIYLDKISDVTGLCIKDQEIESVNEFTLDCTGENEYWITCPGTTSDYGCELINNNTQYKITGLKHSAVKEQKEFCGDSICSEGESCSSCGVDCGSCPAPPSSGGGGGGGGSSSSSRSSGGSTTTSSASTGNDNQVIDDESIDEQVVDNEIEDIIINESEENQGNPLLEFFRNLINRFRPNITGAAIGGPESKQTIAYGLLFIGLVVFGWIGLRFLRKKESITRR